MSAASDRFSRAMLQWFPPGKLYTFVGAGGKSTGIMRAAEELVTSGVRVRVTTTTRVSVEEFGGFPVRMAAGPGAWRNAMEENTPLLLAAAGRTEDELKYRGFAPDLLDADPVPPDVVVLVEGDGARRLPMKVPRDHEPVIPGSSSAVFVLMGASAFDGPIHDQSCYNPEQALALLGLPSVGHGPVLFTADAVAALAAHPLACRKGIRPGMGYRVVVNQGDLVYRRPTAERALEIMKQRSGIAAALLSFQKGEIYGTTD